MTWISESGNMWFPHQVNALVRPLDEKVEKLQSELEKAEDHLLVCVETQQELRRELKEVKARAPTVEHIIQLYEKEKEQLQRELKEARAQLMECGE